MSTIEDTLDRLGTLIVNYPGLIILLFITLTGVFAVGLANVEAEEGTEEFAEGVDAYDAGENIDDQFTAPHGEDTNSLQMIHRDENVLTADALERNLRVIAQIDDNPGLDVEGVTGVAPAVAQSIDPAADTPQEQLDVLQAAPDSTVEQETEALLADTGLDDLLDEDYNPESQSAAASLTILDISGDTDTIQQYADRVSDSYPGEYMMLSDGLIDEEFDAIIGDSLGLVIPVVVVLILLFLIVAYRDPVDLLLGLTSLAMVIIWTFGFTGLAGIPFSEMMIAIPPLLLAIGVDFGIHAVNRYREERIQDQDIGQSMDAATDQLLVAFFIVAGTTMIGFGANAISDLGPIAEFGLVAAFGVIFTFLIFGIFFPAMKVYLDRLREQYNLPEFGSQPLGSEDSLLGKILPAGAIIGRKAPIALLLVVGLITVGGGIAAVQVDTTFDDDDFLPPEDLPAYVYQFPDPMTPGEYSSTEIINYIEDTFASGDDDQVELYIKGPMHADGSLEQLHRVGENPPSTIITDDEGMADSQSIIDVMHSYADDDPEFANKLEASDTTDSGAPDENVRPLLDDLFASEYGDDAREYVTDDYRYATIQYDVEADADDEEIVEDIQSMAADYPYEATPAGTIVVYQQIGDLIFDSAILGLIIALIATALFLMFIYHVLEGYASIGLANLVPIVVTVVLLVGTMPLIGIPLNAMTATILSITIGVGVAYSVHITHRFIDEYEDDSYEALMTTLRGTGGALTGSMLTTLGGASALILAIIPILGQFGILMSISVLYSFLTAILVLPPTLILWEKVMQ